MQRIALAVALGVTFLVSPGVSAAHGRDREPVAVPDPASVADASSVPWVDAYLDGLQHDLDVDAYLQGLQHQLDVDAYLTGLQRAQDQAVAAARRPVSAPASVSAPVTSLSSSGSFLDCVRQRESGGDYSVHNSGGSGASGAYQFLPGTWNATANAAGRSDLVGVDPAQASPADQDAMARQLYSMQGASPWQGGSYSC